MNRNVIKWLRWSVVLPTSIGLGIIYAMFISPILMQAMSKSFEHGTSPLIAGVIAILSAYVIAPTYKFKTSLTIACLWLSAPLIGVIIMIFGIKVNGEEQYLLDGGIALFTTILGILLGLFITWRLTTKHKKSDEAILKRIKNIEGLGSMTVNERLYATELYDEFYNVIKIDKVRARKILIWIKVDESSIDNILKSE